MIYRQIENGEGEVAGMHVAVCDDEDIFREYLKKLLLEYSFKTDEEMIITEYSCGEALLDAYSQGGMAEDVIFLDIRMNGMDGMEAAKLLRGQGCGCLIVFLTSLEEYARRGYEVKAFRYLLKDQAESDLGPVLDACRMELAGEDYFCFSYERCSYSVPKREILYFESKKRLVLLHAAKEEHRFYQKLDDLELQLSGEGFLRCHKSFLVQERHIKSWRENALWLADGTELPISRTYEKEVNRRLMLRAAR